MPRPRAGAALALLALALLIGLARLHTWDEPLETDITGMAVIGQALLDGRPLYSDIWDHKPPAGAVTHAVAIAVAGFGRQTIYLLGVITAVLGLIGVYAAGDVAGRWAGLWAAGFWTVLSGDLWLQANQPNLEAFINVCVIWAFVLLLRDAGATPAWRRFAGAGLLVALASLYKPVAVANVGPLVLAAVVCAAGGAAGRRRTLRGVLLMVAIGVAAWALVAGYFAATGRLDAFVEAVFTYNRFYAGDVWANLARGAQPAYLFRDVLLNVLPLAALGATGLALALATGPRRPWVLLGGLALGTALAVALPGHFYSHYYQLWLPVVTIAGGWAVEALRGRAGGVVAQSVGATVLALLVILQLPLYRLPPDDWSRKKYGKSIFVAERDLARELRTLLRPGETFYDFGVESGLYFETGQRPISGAFYALPLLRGPVASSLTTRAIADLERQPPELLVVVQWAVRAYGHPLNAWSYARYRPVPGEPWRGPFLLLARRGGPLEARLEAAARPLPASGR